ncbi:histidine kinase [Xenococcus sp. PCC 7305]|uniref:histidine kinase n=1 Tax=Xenococcus sp. PCC 7305 TaxID=102125 RepID=UPI0015679C8F
MLQLYEWQKDLDNQTSDEGHLQLLLFVDKRPGYRKKIQRVQAYLDDLKLEQDFQLEVIEIDKQPHLVEYFKLVATPALVKISPQPRQVLAGSNLIEQLEIWWPRWKNSLQNKSVADSQELEQLDSSPAGATPKIASYSDRLLKLSDKAFHLQQEKEELLEQLRFKEQILAMLVHDLRSPLTAASLAMETLELSENHENNEQKKQLRNKLYLQSRQQVNIMKRMISDLLEASTSANAKLKVFPCKLNVYSLCQDVISQVKKQLNAKSQIFNEDIPQDIPQIHADEELVRQLLINLLENAVKYTPEGGEISLSVLHRTSQKVQFRVSDTGPGIPAEKQERIFEDHFRLKRDQEQEGYGLGLAFCRKIVRAHYGQIWVNSSPGDGSCFNFTLPVYR